jgi:hypothetical protein
MTTWVEEAERLEEEIGERVFEAEELRRQAKEAEEAANKLYKERKKVIKRGREPKKGDLVEVRPHFEYDPDDPDNARLKMYPYIAQVVGYTRNERITVVPIHQLRLHEQWKPTTKKDDDKWPMPGLYRDRNPYERQEFDKWVHPVPFGTRTEGA